MQTAQHGVIAEDPLDSGILRGGEVLIDPGQKIVKYSDKNCFSLITAITENDGPEQLVASWPYLLGLSFDCWVSF